MKLDRQYRVAPHTKLRLADESTRATDWFKTEEDALVAVGTNLKALSKLQEVLAASATQALLVVLQGMDAGGKDGTIRHIFTGVNPQGCDVTPFKVPTPLEASHDFLWRVHRAVPAKGKIGIFNRSHYEDVLVTRVHGTIGKKEVRRRYQEILEFEKSLAENGTTILKFFLHISQKEQTARLQSRMDDPDKHWKISAADFRERKFWPQYQQAYQDAIHATSRKHAPWFVIPGDHKWYRNAVISKILVDALKGMKLKYPDPTVDISKLSLS